MEIGQSAHSYAFVKPDPTRPKDGFGFCMDAQGNEMRAESIVKLRSRSQEAKQLFPDQEIYILHQIDRVLDKLK